MRDYLELAKALRCCADGICRDCPRLKTPEGDFECKYKLRIDAADAIEELLAATDSVVKCKDCKWWSKQEASIQGRCARLAIYPTGTFYCASGSKEEPPKGVE